MKSNTTKETIISQKPPPLSSLSHFFKGSGHKYEYDYFTAESIVVNGNDEDFNKNPSFSIFHIMDYTKKNLPDNGIQANGSATQNMSSSYVILSGEEALLIDMGNDPLTTAKNFGENGEDELVFKKLIQEYKSIVLSLIKNRKLTIAITHLHHDHIGYSAAFENEDVTVFFPLADINEEIKDRFKKYNLQPFIPGENNISIGEVIVNTLSCPGHTPGSTLFLISTPLISYNQATTNGSITYFIFSGDAIGSGSSVWFFSLEGLKTLRNHIGAVIENLENIIASNKNSHFHVTGKAEILFLGGHTWQYTNRFGLMNMDIEYIKSMENSLHALADKSKWKYDGDDGLSLEQWLKQGRVVLKSADHLDLYTAYFGTTLTSSAAITCPLFMLKEYAGI